MNTTVTNTIQLEVIDIPKAKIIGGGFGDLATAEAYVNGFKVGDPVTDVSYDVGTDTFEFATEENSDFSKTTGFMSGAQAAGMFEDPHNLIKIFAGNAFAGNSNKTYELGDITVKDVSIFNNAGSNNIKIEKYSFNARGLSYDTGSTFEFGQFIGNGDQPKFVFNSGTRVIVNEDFTLMIGTHGRYAEFCDLKTTNAWGSGNSYDFKSNVIFDNSKNLVTGAATKLYNATFYFRGCFNIINSNGLRVFQSVGLTQDGIYGTNHVYFYGSIGATEGADFPTGTFGSSAAVIYHVPAAKQTSNAGGIEGDLQDIISRGGTVLFDL